MSRGNPLRVVTEKAERAYELTRGETEAAHRQAAWSEYCCQCLNARLPVVGNMGDLAAYYRLRYGDVLR